MSKKALVIAGVIGLIVIITGVVLLLGQKTPKAKEVTVSLSPELSGWQLISHGPYGAKITLPPAWQITVFDNPQGGKGSVRADYLGEGVTASLFLNRYKATDAPSAMAVQENRATNRKSIDKNGVSGVSYETKETKGDYPEGEFIENSYILANKYLLNEETLEISCHLLGSNYQILIPTCGAILNSIQFSQ